MDNFLWQTLLSKNEDENMTCRPRLAFKNYFMTFEKILNIYC